METISRWTTLCNEGHSKEPPPHTGSTFPLCQRAEIEALPTRVLDLGSAGTTGDPALVETRGLTAKYVCLSHCWGQSQCIKTTRSTHDKWKSGIPWSMLPRTYQDAIVITRRLAIHYIWIDSLCIIQDDSADWERESSQMASIYGNSFLTIAATFAADGNGGCFPTYNVQLHDLSLHTPAGEQHTIFVRKHLPHSPYSDRYDERTRNPPLLERAWTFQEHLLAPRVLQCTQSELIWECSSALCCECSYLKPGDAFFKSAYAKATTISRTKALLPLDENCATIPEPILLPQLSDVRTHWNELVQRYSKRRLTFFSDKLPALSGIAKQLQPLLGPGYFAGLWEQDLLHGLFWEVQLRVYPRRTTEYTAPTWSWASVDGQVFYPSQIDLSKPHAEIIAVRCLPSDQDPTGQVAPGASITICAELVAVRLIYNDHSSDPDELEYYVSMNDEEEESNHSPVYGDKRVCADYQFAERGAFYIPTGLIVFCLRIGTPVDRNRPANEAMGQALVLRQVAEASYVRIGMVKLAAERTARWFDKVPRSFVTIL